MSNLISIGDKQFKPFISQQQLEIAVKNVAEIINRDLATEFPVFLVVLNGSFMFAADLLRNVSLPCEVCFIKIKSYEGTTSTGTTTELIGLTADVSNRTVVIVEDIVDTGVTIKKLKEQLNSRNVKQIKVTSALYKPTAHKTDDVVDYPGIKIPDEFVIGYGLDYNELGRNLKEIYVLAK